MGFKISDTEFIDNTRKLTSTDLSVKTQIEVRITGENAFGSVSGYTSGGRSQNAPPYSARNTIDRFPFANPFFVATDVGDLTVARISSAGHSSKSHGYASAGETVAPGAYARVSSVEKFPFAVDSPAVVVSPFLFSYPLGATASSQSSTHAYVSGGAGYFPPGGPPGAVPTWFFSMGNQIYRFPFAAENDENDVGNLSSNRYYAAGQSSSTHGYVSGGANPPPTAALNTIDKFPFASGANASDIGDLSQVRYYAAGQSSSTHGYSTGGFIPPYVNTIDRFPFATDESATDVGNLTGPRLGAGQSSDTHGYISGGGVATPPTPPVFTTNVIERFPFASATTNASNIGDLSQTRAAGAGHQI